MRQTHRYRRTDLLWRYIADLTGDTPFLLGAAFTGREVVSGVGEWVPIGTVWRRNNGHIVVVTQGGLRRPTGKELERIVPLVMRMDRMDRRDKKIERKRRGYRDISDT